MLSCAGKILAVFCLVWQPAVAQDSIKPRARDLCVFFDGIPGGFNAITDVPGVEVGYKTMVRGSGTLTFGNGPLRKGVTVILPKGKTSSSYPAAWFSLNGDGEMTGITYIDDFGMSSGPIGITNTNSVGVGTGLDRKALNEGRQLNIELKRYLFASVLWPSVWMTSVVYNKTIQDA